MLLLGGPLHGTERDIHNGENEITIMAPSPGNPVPTPFKYVRKDIQAETRPGVVFERSVMVEQGMPEQIATQALGAVLMERFAFELVRQFMEGGERVNEQGEFGASGSENSGLIIAKR